MIQRLLSFLAKLLGFSQPAVTKSSTVDAKTLVQRQYRLIDVPRFEGDSDPPPLSWKPCHPSTMRRYKAQMTCPNGHGLILKGHSINANGRVHPSVVCLTEGCDFHEFVRLADWDFGLLT